MTTNESGIPLDREELANVLTHGMGALIALVAIPVLMTVAAPRPLHEVIGLGIFSVTVLMVYLSSTVYHAITHPGLKAVFQKIDHICIYFLIAGTHTPFILFYLYNGLGAFFLVVLWLLVGIGILYKLYLMGRYRYFSLGFYLALGWFAVFDIPPALGKMPLWSLYWIGIGGFFYTFGTFFYARKNMRYNHAVWHCFTMLGSASHFISLYYVATQ